MVNYSLKIRPSEFSNNSLRSFKCGKKLVTLALQFCSRIPDVYYILLEMKELF